MKKTFLLSIGMVLLVVITLYIAYQNTARASANKKETKKVSQTAAPQKGDTMAIITTNQGTMKALIFTTVVPDVAKNFVELAKQGKYTDVPFHRVIKDFMIQGGDFTNRNGTGGYSYKGPGTTIGDQYAPELTHIRGALSWAKTRMPNSIGSQFFIVHADKGAHFLDHPTGGGPAEGYSVFGQLVEGFEVLDKIATTPTGPNDKPLSPMIMENIEIQSVE